MRKSLLTVCLLSAVCLTVYAQKREKYEFKRNLPVYAEQLIADLDYPLQFYIDHPTNTYKIKQEYFSNPIDANDAQLQKAIELLK